MRRLIIILVALWLIGWPVAAQAQETAEGEIAGQVVNGTEGGGSVAGVAITLITYVDDMMSATRTIRADGDGKFQFNNIVTEHTYMVSAKYMEVDYYYPVTFESGAETAHVEVGVCDATASDETIRIGLAHIIISIEENDIHVTKVFWFSNDGDRTYVGTDGVLFFTLPEGAFGFGAPQELMIDYQLLEGNRITYLVPFPPGERQLVYSYRLSKADLNELDIPLEINYPTDIFELMVEGDGVEVAVSQLAPAEPVVTDTGQRFIHFQGKNLPRSTTINLRLSNLSGGSGSPFLIMWVIIGVVVVGIAIYLISRKKRAGVDG